MDRWGCTLADEPRLMFKWRVQHPNDYYYQFDPMCATTLVYAPCCRHIRAADTIVDVRSIPDTVVKGGNYREARDHEWLCDGCLHLLYYDPLNDWTKSKMMEARGAPIALVHIVRAMEHRADIVADFAGRPHNPEQVYDGALEALIVSHRQLVEAQL